MTPDTQPPPTPAAPAPVKSAADIADTPYWALPPPRDTLVVTGCDAVRFIDNFQTAAIARLTPHTGCEAFFTDGRGQIIALANIFRPGNVLDPGNADGAWIDLPTGMARRLHPRGWLPAPAPARGSRSVRRPGNWALRRPGDWGITQPASAASRCMSCTTTGSAPGVFV